MADKQSVAIIGGGVIGGGWAARFALNGWSVKVFDPSDDARRTLTATLDNARRSLPRLTDAALPAEQEIEFCDSVEQAVKNSSWVQESVPERLDIKHSVYRDIQAHAPTDAVLGSSTSGFKPTELQQGAARPEQILVTHPFNPVYLLPLVEVVAGEQTSQTIVDRACSVLTDLGMKPLKVRKEIDAHIADRFLEAVWREGLWMIKDGIATTEEIDDAIRYGFGLRWGQMGLLSLIHI